MHAWITWLQRRDGIEWMGRRTTWKEQCMAGVTCVEDRRSVFGFFLLKHVLARISLRERELHDTITREPTIHYILPSRW